MTKRETYESRTEALVDPIVAELNFTLVDVEYVKEGSDYYLRVYIDKEGGITINDCEAVSRRLSDLLDENDFIQDAYILEVSSPGLQRPLKKEKDYIRNLNREIEVKLYKALDGEKEFVGVLKAYTDQEITLQMEDGDFIIDKKNIALIREYVEF